MKTLVYVEILCSIIRLLGILIAFFTQYNLFVRYLVLFPYLILGCNSEMMETKWKKIILFSLTQLLSVMIALFFGIRIQMKQNDLLHNGK